jgi:hypothetical protein
MESPISNFEAPGLFPYKCGEWRQQYFPEGQGDRAAIAVCSLLFCDVLFGDTNRDLQAAILCHL